MRDDLSEICYDTTRDDVAYLFAYSITALSPDAGDGGEGGEGTTFPLSGNRHLRRAASP